MTAAHERYEMVIGLEVHVQLRTATKAFCGCSTAFGDRPNANTCPVCLALPGALPVLNDGAVELALRAALAIGCTVRETSIFARKNYFYPDLPKGYQISQFDRPLAEHGALDVTTGDVRSRVGITRVHMEEDAGKSLHDRFDGVTAIDLNRAGVPLIEIVSEPDIRSSAQAGAYLRALKQVLEYADVSDCSMELGSLRVDANVSARPHGDTTLRTRTEIKNVNSFSAVEKALELEFERHVATYEADGTIVQQTMLWDAAHGEVRPARSKEGSHDYRYFPEPDLPPLVVTPVRIDSVRASLPEAPVAREQRYIQQYELSAEQAKLLVSTRALADYFEAGARVTLGPSMLGTFVTGAVLRALNIKGDGPDRAEYYLPAATLAKIVDLAVKGTISNSAAQKVIVDIWGIPGGDPIAVVARLGLAQVSDDGALRGWIDEVLAEHPAEAQRFLGGERKLQGVLVGFVMKKSKGSADPKKVNQMLSERTAG